MNRIIIKQLRLTNFKGVRDLTVNFSDSVTNIYGRNGSGKTTVFDAFTWLLFEKDSQDRKNFDIKTLDADGKVIPQLPHEVSAVISVNGADITLTRRYTEKWVKRAGKAEKEYDGNVVERFFNDVPCSQSEFASRIADICREDVFKTITSPTYFTSLKAEEQKKLLLEMAGNITDKEVAGTNTEFLQLLDAINGTSLADFKKAISAKKQRINAELVGLPERIDEKQRDIAKAESEDWSALEAELQSKREARAQIEAQLDSIAEQQRAADNRMKALYADIQQLQQRKLARQNEITTEATREYYQHQQKKSEAQMQLRNIQQRIVSAETEISTAQKHIAMCDEKRAQLIDEWRRYNAKRKEIEAEELHIDESQFVCPTCKRALDVDDIEAKETELRKHFNEEKARKLIVIAEYIERNKTNGIQNNALKQQHETRIAELQQTIEALNAEKNAINASDVMTADIAKPEVESIIAEDATIKQILHDINALIGEAETAKADKTGDDTEELKDGRKMLTNAIEELVAQLAQRKDAEEAKQRVAELEQQMQSLNSELAELERQEFVMSEFSKARSEAIQARIDGLFSIVRFRWLQTRDNGSVKETCEATVDGVPYCSLNHAMQINAGLDIINAYCKAKGISAPVVIDNAESITDILPMQSQIINLIVSHDDKLRVEAQNN